MYWTIGKAINGFFLLILQDNSTWVPPEIFISLIENQAFSRLKDIETIKSNFLAPDLMTNIYHYKLIAMSKLGSHLSFRRNRESRRYELVISNELDDLMISNHS